MLSLLIFMFAPPAFSLPALPERLRCAYLFEHLSPQYDLPNFIVPHSVPHDGRLTTPMWHRRSPFERAFTMTTEISEPYALSDLTLEELNELERAFDAGRGAPRLRRELRGFASWSTPLAHDRTIDAAISPTAVLDDLLAQTPGALFLIEKLSVYFYTRKGTPPSWEMMAEARGALLMARAELPNLRADVGLEVHTIGPLPENPKMYVDFGIDVRGIPRP